MISPRSPPGAFLSDPVKNRLRCARTSGGDRFPVLTRRASERGQRGPCGSVRKPQAIPRKANPTFRKPTRNPRTSKEPTKPHEKTQIPGVAFNDLAPDRTRRGRGKNHGRPEVSPRCPLLWVQWRRGLVRRRGVCGRSSIRRGVVSRRTPGFYLCRSNNGGRVGLCLAGVSGAGFAGLRGSGRVPRVHARA